MNEKDPGIPDAGTNQPERVQYRGRIKAAAI